MNRNRLEYETRMADLPEMTVLALQIRRQCTKMPSPSYTSHHAASKQKIHSFFYLHSGCVDMKHHSLALIIHLFQLITPTHGLLLGQYTLSSQTFFSGQPVNHFFTDNATEFLLFPGTLQLLLRYYGSVKVKTWLGQEIIQYPFPFFSAMRWRRADMLVWYCSMQVRFLAPQLSSNPLLVRHSMPISSFSDHVSQADWMAKRGTLTQGKRYSANMHFHLASGFAATHSGAGGSTSTFEKFIRFWNDMRKVFFLIFQSITSRKIPESANAHTLALLGARSAIQLTHWQTATAPADCPATTISVAFRKIQ